MDAIAFHSGGSSARSQKITNPRDRRSPFTNPFWRLQHQEQHEQHEHQEHQEQQQRPFDQNQQNSEEAQHEQEQLEQQEQRDRYQQHLELTAEKLRRELEAMLVADVDRDVAFQLKLTSKLDQWHAFHERATRRLSGSADGAGPSTNQTAEVQPLEADQSDGSTCPSEQSGDEAESRAAEAEARAAEGVAQAAEGEARAASGEARAAKGVALAGAAALETREAKAAESENAPVAPKQLEAAADARGAALEAALQVQREELEAKAVVIQELQVRLHAAATREAGLEASLKLQREELEAKTAEALAARAAEVAELQQQLDVAVVREAAFDASLKLQREESEAKAAEMQDLQEQLQEAGVREAAFDASLKLQREELEAKAAEALAAQAGMEERRRVRAAEEAAARLAEVEVRFGEVERERERLARNLSRLQQHLLDRDADDALRLEREAERICQLECQLADKAKALGQSECERVVLERQLADKASQLGQSERRRVRLEQQLEERSREVREAHMQLAQLQAWAEPAGQARQMDLCDRGLSQVEGEGGVVRAEEAEEARGAGEEKQERQGMSQKEVLLSVAPGLSTGLGTGSAAAGTLPGMLPDVLRQVLEAAHRPIATGHPMCMHAGMLASVPPMEDGDASHAADVASHHASGAGTGAAAPVAGARAADGSASAAPSASYAADAAAASCVDAWAAAASHAAATPAFEQARQNSAQVLAREAMCLAAQSSLEAEGAITAGDAAGSVGEQHRETTGRPGPGVAEAGRECEIAALVEENGRLEAERNRAEEERAREEERCARMGEEMRELRGNLQRQAQLEEALSEVAAGRRERGALEEELLRLQCALDQCMLRLNSDSAYMVDRRIVVKLLVAYFQRNRSREVLDIMCRILECSKDERQQLELAASQPALTRSASFKSKGSVRQGSSKGSKGGVFGLPGRIAGGFMGSNRSSSESLGGAGKDSQKQEEVERKPEAKKSGSLTDLWVSIPPTAAHVPTAAGETHPITLLSPKVSSLPATIPIVPS
ncbi:unnamed protein product [Closterium sp. Naga37s-1]|nr:unnamed protein product [Closterium sp. Naga37s-1]